MVALTEFKMNNCGLDVALDVVGGKWKMLILYHLCHGTRRFGELRRLLPGISEKMLIQDLRQMQIHDLIARKDFHEVPPRVAYSATPFGQELGAAMGPLCEWGSKSRQRVRALELPQNELPEPEESSQI
jgi:DNA-binding HxlR family transcriptional regulator